MKEMWLTITGILLLWGGPLLIWELNKIVPNLGTAATISLIASVVWWVIELIANNKSLEEIL